MAFRVHKQLSILGQSQVWIDAQGFCQPWGKKNLSALWLTRHEDGCDQDGLGPDGGGVLLPLPQSSHVHELKTPNAHVSATLWGLINANASGVTGSASSFTDRSERPWFYFRHTVSHPAAHFGTWIKFSCVILTLSLLNSLNACCCPPVMSSRCPHRQLALQKRKLYLLVLYFKSAQFRITMFWLTNLIGVFVMVGWEGGIVLLLL